MAFEVMQNGSAESAVWRGQWFVQSHQAWRVSLRCITERIHLHERISKKITKRLKDHRACRLRGSLRSHALGLPAMSLFDFSTQVTKVGAKRKSECECWPESREPGMTVQFIGTRWFWLLLTICCLPAIANVIAFIATQSEVLAQTGICGISHCR